MKKKAFGLLNKEIDRATEEVVKANKNLFVEPYKKHASEELILAILKYNLGINFQNLFAEADKTGNDVQEHQLLNAIYKSVIVLFEHWLEGGCKIVGNGHHRAQFFSEKFVKEFKYDRSKEADID